jgi:hypothetical protein
MDVWVHRVAVFDGVTGKQQEPAKLFDLVKFEPVFG